MTNFKFSKWMRLFAILSSVVIVLGVAIGLVCQFVFGGFFNYGEEYKDYNSVAIQYGVVDYTESEVREVAEKAFADKNVAYYAVSAGTENVVYKFDKTVAEEAITSAVAAINTSFAAKDNTLNTATFVKAHNFMGGAKTLAMLGIALGVAVVLQFVYVLIRYQLKAALAALCLNVHNLALFLAVLAVSRIPVSASVFTFGMLVVLLTMVGNMFTNAKAKTELSKEENKKASQRAVFEAACARSATFQFVLGAGFACFACLMGLLSLVASFPFMGLLFPALALVLGAAVVVYGNAFVAPSVLACLYSDAAADEQN